MDPFIPNFQSALQLVINFNIILSNKFKVPLPTKLAPMLRISYSEVLDLTCSFVA